MVLFISRPHGEPVGCYHHLHYLNIYCHYRKACWAPCCSWMVKGNHKMQRLPPFVPVLGCDTWLWCTSWECAHPGDQHLLQTAAGDTHGIFSQEWFFFLCFSWCNLNMSRGILWCQQQLPQAPEQSWSGTVSYTELTSPTKLGELLFLWWVIATPSAAIKELTACSLSPFLLRAILVLLFLLWANIFEKPFFLWLICKGSSV